MPSGDYLSCEYCLCYLCDEHEICEVGLENCDDCDLLGDDPIDKCFE
jgi:hypothetical protein